MIFSCRQLISFCSQFATLRPGTVILTGTPFGVGVGRKPPGFLRAGDRVEVIIAGIGALANPVVKE
jgi:2-keto-4-pentenoate hydratase/2-oxohepta-3-ene-1,7-dioic acid hydratase in catechol pathway